MPAIRVLELSGSPYEMGWRHGAAHAGAIRHFSDERQRLSGAPKWTGRALPPSEVIALAEACLPAHRQYAPALMDELQGMADASGETLARLIINNGFTDFIDTVYAHGARVREPLYEAHNCTAFLVSNAAAAQGKAMYGQTWDMHASATPHVLLLRGRPAEGPAFLVLSVAGCVGMMGMNEAGICIGVNNLMGGDGQVGVTWPFVIRRALAQTTLAAALACVTEAPLAGAHNYLLLDRDGRGYNIEAMSSRQRITPLAERNGGALVHTNHCLFDETAACEREREPFSLASSEKRLRVAEAWLSTKDSPNGSPQAQQAAITPETLMALTRDEAICQRPQPPLEVESCGAVIMRPGTGEFWACWGPPADGQYERFEV